MFTLYCAVSHSALDQLSLKHERELVREEIGHENKWRLMCMHHYTLRRNLSNVIMVETKKVQKQDVIYTVL
jgi:hypothetical protein